MIDVGPYQDVVAVSWGGGPSLLTITEYHQGWPRDAFTFSRFLLTARILSPFADGEIPFGSPSADGGGYLNGQFVASHTAAATAGADFSPGASAILIDLRRVRAAFALGPLGDGAGEVPGFIDVEIGGYIHNGGDETSSGSVSIRLESWGGRNAFGREIERSPDHFVYSIFDGSGNDTDRASGGFPVRIETSPFLIGTKIKTLRVRLDRIGFGTDEGDA